MLNELADSIDIGSRRALRLGRRTRHLRGRYQHGISSVSQVFIVCVRYSDRPALVFRYIMGGHFNGVWTIPTLEA